MPEGKIQSFDVKKGTGYIESEDGAEAIPFDRKDVKDTHTGDLITSGDAVTYQIEKGQGRSRAIEIRRVAKRGYE